jgi:hypothetical protein
LPHLPLVFAQDSEQNRRRVKAAASSNLPPNLRRVMTFPHRSQGFGGKNFARLGIYVLVKASVQCNG